MLAAAALAFSPLGQDFIYAAFFSNEQLSRNIAQPFVYAAMLALLALGGLEWWIKRMLRRRPVE